MKIKLFNQLKQAYASKYGVTDEIIQGQADALAATGLVTDENIATVIQGQEPAFRAVQSRFDRTRTDHQKELDELRAKPVEKPIESGDVDIKKLIEAQETISKELSSLKQERAQGTLSTSLIALLKEKKVPESYYSVAIDGRQFSDESDVVSFASKLENSYTVHKQGLKDLGFAETIPPTEGAGALTETNQIAELINSGTKVLTEKK